MAKVLLEDWKEQYRDERIERMSRDEMSALQSERLVKQVKNVYEHVSFYKKKMDDLGVEPGDIKGIEDITKLPFTTKEDLRNNYPFGLLAVPKEKITRVQGTSGTTGKLTLASYTNKQKTDCISAMGMDFLQEVSVWTLEHVLSEQWQFRCLPVIPSDS